MEEYFASLTRRQQMLLLTGVTFGGSDANAAFEHLMPDEAEVLKWRAGKLLEIPRDKRIPLLVQEIKRLVTSRKTYLWNAEPAAFAKLLSKERPALRETILRALPVALAEAVREHLPPSAAAPDRELKPGVLAVIRWKLEELLEQASAGAMWKFSDMLLLKPREIWTVVDRQGVRALGIAFAAMPKEEREAAFSQLPPDIKHMAQRATDAAEKRALGGSEAQALLKSHGFDRTPLDGIRSAGVQRLARACMAQGSDFAQRMAERHRPPFVAIFQKWMNDDRTKAAARGDGGRAEIVAELERLETKGLVEKPTRLPALKPKPMLPPPPAARSDRHSSAQPSAKGAAPAPKKPTPNSQRLPSQVIAPKAPSIDNVDKRRDPIAEREARRAGAVAPSHARAEERHDPIAEREARKAGVGAHYPPKAEERHFRDPIAERNARRAGVASAREIVSGENEIGKEGPPPSGRMYRPPALRIDRDDRPAADQGARGSGKNPAPAEHVPANQRPPSARQPGPGSERKAAVLSPIPAQMKNHPRGVGSMSEDLTDPSRRQARPPSPSTSQPIADPSGSRLHRIRPDRSSGLGIKAYKENRIMKGGESKSPPSAQQEPAREPKVLSTGPRTALKMAGLDRVKGPRPPPLPPRGKGPGRGPGGNSG